jgi:prolipoprotein diacylglyceryltransferase
VLSEVRCNNIVRSSFTLVHNMEFIHSILRLKVVWLYRMFSCALRYSVEGMRQQNILFIYRTVCVIYEEPYISISKKKLWQQLVAYFSLIRHKMHRKRHLKQILITTIRCLLSRCLAMTGGYTDRPTDSPLIRHRTNRN